MLARVESLPKPDPDVNHLLAVLRRDKPNRVPMLEIKLDDEVQAALLDEPLIPWAADGSADQRRRSVRQHLGLMHRLGYDAVRIPNEALMNLKEASQTCVSHFGDKPVVLRRTPPLRIFRHGTDKALVEDRSGQIRQPLSKGVA